MSGRSITSWMSLNRQLTSGDPLVRQFRLPRLAPFPKLSGDARATPAAAARRAPAGTAVAILGHADPLPEMTTDLLDPTGGYTVGNVRRSDVARSAAGRSAWAHLVGRVLGGGRSAARW